MEPTVLVLLSDKRSGSTILQQELCKHPGVGHVVYSPHTYCETQHWLKAGSLLETPRQCYYGHSVYSTYKNPAVARQYMVDFLLGNEIDLGKTATDRQLVFDGWEQLCQKYARPVFFEKSPQHLAQWAALSLLLEWMESTKFKVRILGLVRNPLSVLYSAYELFHSLPEERQHGWADMHRNLLAFQAMAPPECFHLIRYEDMIASPKDRFREILEFAGLPACDEVGKSVHTHSANKWHDDAGFVVQLHESVKQVARHFGYTDDEMYNPPKPPISSLEQMRRRFRKFNTQAKGAIINRMIKPLLLRSHPKKR